MPTKDGKRIEDCDVIFYIKGEEVSRGNTIISKDIVHIILTDNDKKEEEK